MKEITQSTENKKVALLHCWLTHVVRSQLVNALLIFCLMNWFCSVYLLGFLLANFNAFVALCRGCEHFPAFLLWATCIPDYWKCLLSVSPKCKQILSEHLHLIWVFMGSNKRQIAKKPPLSCTSNNWVLKAELILPSEHVFCVSLKYVQGKMQIWKKHKVQRYL